MSLNFIQSALQKSIHNPELYSPSTSPINPSTPVVGSVAGSVSWQLDGITEEDPAEKPEQTLSAKLRTIAKSSNSPVATRRLRRSKESAATWLKVTPYSDPSDNQTQTSSGSSFDIYEYASRKPEEYASLTGQNKPSPNGQDKMIIPQPAITARNVRTEEEGDGNLTQTTIATPHIHDCPPALAEIPIEVAERAPETLTPVVREALNQPRMTRAQKAAAEKAKDEEKEKLNRLGDTRRIPPLPKTGRFDDPNPTPNPWASKKGEPSTSAFNPFVDTEMELSPETGEPSTSDQGAWNKCLHTLLHEMNAAEDRRQFPETNKTGKPSPTQTTQETLSKTGDWNNVPEYPSRELASAIHQQIKTYLDKHKDEDRQWHEPKAVEQLMEMPSVDLLRACKRMNYMDILYTGKETGVDPPDPKLPFPTYPPQEGREMDSNSASNLSTASGEQANKNRCGVIGMAGQGWIRRHLEKNDFADGGDLVSHDHKVFDVEAPKTQLIRAKNFLASQNVEHTPDWDKKFDALCQYTKHLLNNYNNEDWGQDLFDVVRQLRAHRIWDKYMYSPPKLDLDISNGKGQIYPGPKRFHYDEHSVVDFEKYYRPIGAPRFDHERGALAGKSPGLFIQPHRVEDPPGDAHIDPLAFNKGMKWFISEQQKWVEWTAEHALKEAYGHKRWKKRKEDIMPLPAAANWNGPVVNISMDKKMYETYQKVKIYEALIEKLHRTVWKTAVYGKRPVLLKCLEGIDHGLFTGQGWTTIPSDGPQNPIDEDKKEWEKLPIRPLEWEWLEFLTMTSSPNPALKKMAPQKAVFVERLMQLLDNPRDDGIFAKFVDSPTKTPIPELTEAINFGLKRGDVQRGLKKLYIFEEKDVWDYAEFAEQLGMVHRIEQRARGGNIIRGVGELVFRGVLPEERIHWNVPINATQARNETEEEQSEEEDDDSSDDSVSVASTMSTQIGIPASEPDHGDYSRALPCFKDLLPWNPLNGENQQTNSDKVRTAKFYQRLGARLGLELHILHKDLRAMEEALSQTDGKVRENQTFLFDTLSFWKDDYNKRTQNRKNPAANGERQVPLYKDIVSIADPKSQERQWRKKDSWADAEEAEAREIVRQGIIREHHANKTNIWPARGDTSSEPGSKFPFWRREDLWSFGAPGARGFKARKFFSLNRWPVHLQDEEIQKEIRGSGPPPAGVDESQKISDEQAVKFAPANIVQDGQRTIWRPGNEYWLGATPRQQRAIWRRNHLMGEKPEQKQTWKGKLTALFTRKRKRDQEDLEQDDIDSFETGSLRLPSPGYEPKMISSREAAERKAKAARLRG